jgi:hypothetical protein
MPIVLDPTKSFVNITIYYIEERKKNGNSVFHFINSAESLEEWKAKGYKTRQEITQELQNVNPNNQFNVPKATTPQVIAAHNKIIEVIQTVWKRMTWKEQNAVFAQSLRVIAGESEIDALKYRELKLRTCLKKWDAKDDDGNPLPLTPETLDNLCPEVASELLRSFERVTEPSEEDLK